MLETKGSRPRCQPFLTRERFLHSNMSYPGYSSIFTPLRLFTALCCIE